MKKSLNHFLNEVENLQMFSLCKDFDNLSLDNKTSSEQPSSYGYRSTFRHFLRSCQNSLLSKSIIEKVQAPFIEFPRYFMDSLPFQPNNLYMNLGFRFHPGQSNFLINELKFPNCFDRLSLLSNSLGLSYNSRPLTELALFPYCSSGTGMRSLVSDRYSKILVEVITYYEGWYGRFMVLVSLGVCCTVWYGYAPGSPYHAPDVSMFTPLDSYDPFFNMDYYAPGFHRIGIVEINDVSASVESSFGNELPFADITIPANGPVLKAVGLGVMVAFFLAVGLVPNVPGAINGQL